MTFDLESFRLAMRTWTTGVAVLMAGYEDESYGMTVNSFTSLSLDPPLVTVVLKSDTRVFELVTKSRAFSVTILSSRTAGTGRELSPENCTAPSGWQDSRHCTPADEWAGAGWICRVCPHVRGGSEHAVRRGSHRDRRPFHGESAGVSQSRVSSTRVKPPLNEKCHFTDRRFTCHRLN